MTTPASPIRLAYTLAFVPHSQRAILLPRHLDKEEHLIESEVRALRGRLHPLDVAIAQELVAGTVFGQLSDTQLVRLLPVLAQRRTRLGQARLSLKELTLLPRLQVTPQGRGLALALWFQEGAAGSTALEDGVQVTQGRLLLGAQAFFLRGNTAYPVRVREPWALAHWAREPVLTLGPERLGAPSRDALVRDLLSGGIPEGDLEALEVHRGPPSRFVVRYLATDAGNDGAELTCRLEAHYEQGVVPLTGAQKEAAPAEGLAVASAAHVPAPNAALGVADAEAPAKGVAGADGTDGEAPRDEEDLEEALEPDFETQLEAPIAPTERDIEAENDAVRAMRLLGFRLDRPRGTFVAQGELALRALDPSVKLFDTAWSVERDAASPTFHHDLRLTTRASMVEERGLINLAVDVRAVTRPPAAEGQDDGNAAETVAALISMQELLSWLHSGQRYVRLADGSYAAPSANFRQGLRILGDLGADTSRALISPLCVGLLRAMGDVSALGEVDQAVRTLLDELIGGEVPKRTPMPKTLKVEMRDYQRRGLDWLMMLHRHRLTGILADDMGLGKTLQTLALLLAIKEAEGQKPSLVVAPTSVVTVWRDEAERFAPDLKVTLWYGTPQERQNLDVTGADLVVTSYGVLRRDAERLGEVGFRYVILDEAQSTKNARSLGAHAIRQLKSERRLALSGTPLENRPEELWSIFDFLAPGFLGSLRKFRRTYALPITRGDKDAMALLRLKIEPLVLRRLKKEVAKELPDKVESTIRCEMGPSQRALYDHVAGELKENIKEKIAQVGIEQAQLDILAALTRLRQICCDPALLPTPSGAKVPPSAKLQLFEELMREALASERAVVVFSQFVQMQRRLIEVVRTLGVEPLWLHGGTVHRDRVVAAFQDPKGPPVIVVSLKAGGTGLTLTRADTVMHFDPWWNPAVERQATDRAHRLGQTQTVSVYRLVCAHSIEERVLKMAESKEALASNLLGSEGGPQGKHIGREEILALLS